MSVLFCQHIRHKKTTQKTQMFSEQVITVRSCTAHLGHWTNTPTGQHLFSSLQKQTCPAVNPTFRLKGMIFTLKMVRFNVVAFLYAGSNTVFKPSPRHIEDARPWPNDARANITKWGENDRPRTRTIHNDRTSKCHTITCALQKQWAGASTVQDQFTKRCFLWCFTLNIKTELIII